MDFQLYLGVMKVHPTYDYASKGRGILNRVKQRALYSFYGNFNLPSPNLYGLPVNPNFPYTGSIQLPFAYSPMGLATTLDTSKYQYGLKADSSNDF